jgi:hypothetical protein
MNKHSFRVSILGALVLLPVFGQSDASRLVGTVKDPSGAVVPNVSITLTNEKTGQERKVASDSNGYYIAPNLSPSTYKIAAQGAGFGLWQASGVALSVGQERTLDISLQPASVTSEVNVSGGELSAVDTSSAAIGTNINSREVAMLPLNGRQLSQLYLLAPGAQTAGGGSFDNIRFSGRANPENAVRFDGV